MSAMVCAVAAALAISGCSAKRPSANVSKHGSKEYFAESDYGVKASPRMSGKKSGLRRGGGRNQVGKPYKVKGKWYYPKAVNSYSKIGKASWYGAAFHGRLTANGEIYDMTHLTAAHPTLPLPSYARVTNLKNGNSVIVRINDRGPFARGRVIDLSKRAAELLDYTQTGIARVKVDYIGRAPLHGRDDSYLLASYRPSGRAPGPSDGLANGVMIALNGSTPVSSKKLPPALIGGGSHLPDAGPILKDRPGLGIFAEISDKSLKKLSYTGEGASLSSRVLDRFASNNDAASEPVAGLWKEQDLAAGKRRDAVFAGTFSKEQAERLHRLLGQDRNIKVDVDQTGIRTWTSITVWPNRNETLNELLQSAWAAGAADAMIMRD